MINTFFMALVRFIKVCQLDLDNPYRVAVFDTRLDELREAFDNLDSRETEQAELLLNELKHEWREFFPSNIVKVMR